MPSIEPVFKPPLGLGLSWRPGGHLDDGGPVGHSFVQAGTTVRVCYLPGWRSREPAAQLDGG
jgi:hypothetical protein